MHTRTSFALLAVLAASAATVACGTETSTPNPAGVQRASLHRSKNCGDLLSDLKADASYKVNKAINRQIEAIQYCVKKYGEERCAYYGGYYNGGGAVDDFGVGRDEAASGANKGGAPPPQASPTGSSSSSSGGGGEASSYSETNTQVKGVDEADIIKNDGKNIYVLHGRSFKIVNAWPATDLKEVGSIDVEGQPSEMFVADGKVVVYSQVNGAKIFQAAGVTPKTTYQDYGYGGGPYPAGGVAREGDIAPPGGGGGGGSGEVYAPLTKVTVMSLNGTTPVVTREVYFEGSYLDARRVGSHVRTVLQSQAYGPKLKYSIYELYDAPQTGAKPVPSGAPEDRPVEPTEPTQPTNDPTPKTGSQMIAALEQLRAHNLAAISASTLPEWLPFTFVKEGSAVSAKTIACEDFYVPTVGSTQSGMTEVAAIDLADPGAVPKESGILGRAETVYGSADTLYLAAQAYVEPPFSWRDLDEINSGGGVGGTDGSEGGGSSGIAPTEPAPAPAPTPVPGGKQAAGLRVAIGGLKTQNTPAEETAPVVTYSQANTHIHKFDFKAAPNFPNYVASGTVSGTLKNQFSMDDRNGILRVATTEQRQYVTTEGKWVSSDSSPPQAGLPAPKRPNTVSHVFTMSQQGPWLDQEGAVKDLAPNEQIYSVRFVGGRGYVVTFRQVDPLFVLDLQNPKTPTLLAALKIPGFSEYMHPLDDNHLLTIGRDASATGRQQGLQLQIFDVTDGARPRVVQKFTYTGQEYGQSEAEYDHKAFTYFDDRNLLAFPYYSYSNTGEGGMRSSLELFRVDQNTGFTKLGSVDSTNLAKQNPSGYCGGYYAPSVRRGVFLENFVYSISYGGVVVRDSNNLNAPIGTELALPVPTTNEGYGPSCGGGF